MRQEMLAANERQMALKAAGARRVAEEEESARAAMLAKFAADDRLEQMNAQRRRMKQLEHRREVRCAVAVEAVPLELLYSVRSVDALHC